jgi:hypothetical protein
MFYSAGSQKKAEIQCTGICHCQRTMACWSHNWMTMAPHCKRNNHHNEYQINNTVSYLFIFQSRYVYHYIIKSKQLYTQFMKEQKTVYEYFNVNL